MRVASRSPPPCTIRAAALPFAGNLIYLRRGPPDLSCGIIKFCFPFLSREIVFRLAMKSKGNDFFFLFLPPPFSLSHFLFPNVYNTCLCLWLHSPATPRGSSSGNVELKIGCQGEINTRKLSGESLLSLSHALTTALQTAGLICPLLSIRLALHSTGCCHSGISLT